jgi:hypothetical protein
MQRAAAPLGFIALALLPAAAPPPPRPQLGGRYLLQKMETASELRLTPDGRFAWAWSQGAIDLQTEGRWRREGDRLLLDSEAPEASVFCCRAYFKTLPLTIGPRMLELRWGGETLRYEALDLPEKEP